jgi:uncharacterized protein (DUF924 family)
MGRPEDVLAFWFGAPATTAAELGQKMKRWYQGGPEMDRQIGELFLDDTERALLGERDAWAKDLHGRVALVILLDQFPRSLWRDQPKAYAGDTEAQRLACEAFDKHLDAQLTIDERMFLIMPLMHAENLALQERAISLMDRLVGDAPAELRPVYSMGIEQSRKYRDIIARYGRFPHRNAILGRESTPDELEFLKTWAQKMAPTAPPEAGGT